MRSFYQVLPSDGVGGTFGHGLAAAVQGLLWPRRSLVVSTPQLECSFCVLSASDRVFSIKCLFFQGRPQHWPHSNSRFASTIIGVYVLKIGNYQHI